MDEYLIKVLYASNKLGILAIDKERNDPHLFSLRQKLEDCQHEIIDLANREGIDLSDI